MILYQLKCRRDHEFEAWFLNGAAYDSQQASGDVGCPFCGTTEVTKAMVLIMPSWAPKSTSRSRPSEATRQRSRSNSRAALT